MAHPTHTHGKTVTLFVTPAIYLYRIPRNCNPLIWETDILALISVVSAGVGFAYGAYRDKRQTPHDPPTKTEEEEDEDNLSSDEESAADGDLSAVTAGFLKPCKLVRRSGICCMITPLTGPHGQTFKGPCC